MTMTLIVPYYALNLTPFIIQSSRCITCRGGWTVLSMKLHNVSAIGLLQVQENRYKGKVTL